MPLLFFSFLIFIAHFFYLSMHERGVQNSYMAINVAFPNGIRVAIANEAFPNGIRVAIANETL